MGRFGLQQHTVYTAQINGQASMKHKAGRYDADFFPVGIFGTDMLVTEFNFFTRPQAFPHGFSSLHFQREALHSISFVASHAMAAPSTA